MALADHRVRVVNNAIELERFLSRQLYAKLLGNGDQAFPYTHGAPSETLIIDGSNDGGATWTYFQRTWTDPSTGPHTRAELLAEINAAANWDGGTLPTEFTIDYEGTGDTLVIKSTTPGNQYGIRVNASSTAIGAVSNADLLFTGGANTTGGDGGSDDLDTLVKVFPDNSGKAIVVYTVPS